MKPLVLISHITSEAAIAIWLKEQLSGLLLGAVDFFVSSDRTSIVAGDRWLVSIEEAIKKSTTVIVLCSYNSIRHPWINFEAGGAWLSGKRVIPICHGGLSPSSLPEPLKSLQGIALRDPAGFRDILAILASEAGLRMPHCDADKIVATIPAIAETTMAVSARIFDDHRSNEIQSHYAVISRAKRSVKLFTTTGASCLLDDEIFDLICQKANSGCEFRFLLLDPDSWAIRDRSRQDRDIIDLPTMKAKIASAIDRFQLLRTKLNPADARRVDLRLYDCASAFQALIVDDEEMYVAPRIYGIKSTSDAPCLRLIKRDKNGGVFEKYLNGFSEIWNYNSYVPAKMYHAPRLQQVQYLETWCALNTSVGCSLSCSYCFTKDFEWGQEVTRISTPDSVIDALLHHRLFIRGETILCIGTKTEPFLQENTDDTLHLLRHISEYKLTNPLVLLTRGIIDDTTLKAIEALPDIAPILVVTFSGLPPKYGEPQARDIEEVVGRLSRSHRVIHSWRPIVPGVNTDRGCLSTILAIASKYCDASVCVGLKYSERMRPRMEAALGLSLPPDVTKDRGFGIFFPPEIEKRIAALVRELCPNHPVFFGLTSCALSCLLRRPDYLANRLVYSDRCNSSLCPDQQRRLCESVGPPHRSSVEHVLRSLFRKVPEFEVREDCVFVDDSIPQEVALWVGHRLGFPVQARKITSDLSIWSLNRSENPRD